MKEGIQAELIEHRLDVVLRCVLPLAECVRGRNSAHVSEHA